MSKTAGAELVGAERATHVQQMFGHIVQRYDLMNLLMTMGRDRAWRRRAVSLAVPSGALALDVATGTGDLAIELTRQGAKRVVGVDFCWAMVAAADKKTRREVPGETIRLVAGDAMRLPFADGSFDCLVNGFLLRNVADLAATLREMARVLRPGGRLVCLEITHPKKRWFAAFFGLYFYRLVPLLGWLISSNPDAYYYLPHSLTHFPDADRLAVTIAQAGFAHVTYRRLGLGTVALHSGIKQP